MNEYRVRRGRPIAGELTVPGDLLTTRLAIVVAALANGPSVLTGFLPAEECRALLDGAVGRGAKMEFLSSEDADILWQPDPEHPGLLPTRVRIQGISMGSGARGLIELLPPGPDRELLLALLKRGKSTVPFPAWHPDHLRRILHFYQIKTRRAGDNVITYGGQVPESRDFRVPGDTTVAAQWITAAAMQPGSELTVRGIGLNAGRTAFLRMLVAMGAQITEDFWPSRNGEILGTVIVRGAPLHGINITESQSARMPGELAVIAVAAAFAKGTTTVRVPPHLHEAAVRIAHNLRLIGATVRETNGGFDISGSALSPLQAGCLPSYGDPALAMAFAIAGLVGEGETIVEDITCVEKTWAGFGQELRRFQSRAISEGNSTPVINTWKTGPAPRKGDPEPHPTHPK